MNSSPPLSQESKIVPELIGLIEKIYKDCQKDCILVTDLDKDVCLDAGLF